MRDSVRHLREKYAASNWYVMPRAFFLICDPAHAALLAHICNVAEMRRKERKERPGGWFQCGQRSICNTLRIEARKQDRMIAKLKRQGLIDTKRMGMPCRRYIRVDFRQIDSTIQTAAQSYAERKQLEHDSKKKRRKKK